MNKTTKKIRVENQPDISVSTYHSIAEINESPVVTLPFTILFIKPFQEARNNHYGPPLGILTLIAGIRQHFGDTVTVHFWDMMLYNDKPEALAERIDEFRPDIIGVSALNCEAAASFAIAAAAKVCAPKAITVIGGPFTLRQADLIFGESLFDWVFEGAADRSFLQALTRQFSGQPLGDDIPGFSHRTASGEIVYNHKQDLITDLDAIPLPAWDLLDFERYRKRDRKRMITNVDERKYAYLFTSRGCPYLCNYCHDIFTKRFVYRSDENVLEEIRILYEDYGVTEFHIIDDIFNLHRPRAQSIMRAIQARWPGKLFLAFPNGLRGDILDQETIQAMADAGTYNASISIETVTPRLQVLAEKYLDIEKAKWAIEEFTRQGVVVHGALMLGFPSETEEEIEATLSYAISSPLMHVHLFAVVPQPQTPIYELALQASAEATIRGAADERESGDYHSLTPWYTRAYGYDLRKKLSYTYVRFYLHPPRLLRMLRTYPLINLLHGGFFVLQGLMATAQMALLGLCRKMRLIDPPALSKQPKSLKVPDHSAP
ncbi:MAG: B12-binding domain-containing radical SAM protein [Fluviicoccus sp.]|uniref:B12-binding domain-containing radical SAM protein n=1 Tax=Fluviicoccus sp. TaxID=2003552 RepID=UPI00271A6DE9|nr:radical SAM protein [Fluviicoccus sp.]MDO8329313.1 B12-binding domain-containing radical SAM protein [Fluviicoccus sp.]